MGELQRAGHQAVAMDLPCDDDAAGAADYAAAVLAALPQGDEPIVVVAHSLGGLTAPLVPAARPTRCLIFVSALLPVPGTARFRATQQAEEEIMSPYHGGVAGLRDRFFNRCDPADADWAMSRLRRQSETPFTETTPLVAWPDVPVAYVFSSDDRAVSPDWSRRAARERLAVEPVELLAKCRPFAVSQPSDGVECDARRACRGGMKVYDALARAFVKEGTRGVFTMMGDANMYWLNALSRLGVRIYDVRHEGAGLAMADGWGQRHRQSRASSRRPEGDRQQRSSRRL